MPAGAGLDSELGPRDAVTVTLSGTWVTQITTPTPGTGVSVEFTNAIRSAADPLLIDLGEGFTGGGASIWRGTSIEFFDPPEPGGQWTVRFHVRGTLASGADSGDVVSPVIPFVWDTNCANVAAILTAVGPDAVAWGDPVVLCNYEWDGNRNPGPL